MNEWSKNMNEWINNCDKETLHNIIQAARKIDNNYKRMKDGTILKKLINNEIALHQIFEFIEDPPEFLQLAAVKQNGHTIQYIKNPSEEMKLAAVKQNGWAIAFIKNPSEEMKLTAVAGAGAGYGLTIAYIDGMARD